MEAVDLAVSKAYDGTTSVKNAKVTGHLKVKGTNIVLFPVEPEILEFSGHDVSDQYEVDVTVKQLDGDKRSNYILPQEGIKYSGVKAAIVKADFTNPNYMPRTFEIYKGQAFPEAEMSRYIESFQLRGIQRSDSGEVVSSEYDAKAEFYWDSGAESGSRLTGSTYVEKEPGVYDVYVKVSPKEDVLTETHNRSIVLQNPLKLKVVTAPDTNRFGTEREDSSQGVDWFPPIVEKSVIVAEKEQSTATIKIASKENSDMAAISDAGVEQAIRLAKKEASKRDSKPALEIQVESKNEVDRFSLSLSKKAYESLAKSEVATVRVNSNLGAIQLDDKTIAAIAAKAKGADVEITILKAEKELNPEQLGALQNVENKKVYDVFVTSAGENITTFDGGKISVSVPFAIRANELPNRVMAWYISDAGAKERVQSVYDADAKTLTFTTNHLSRYAVVYEPWENPYRDVAMQARYFDAVKYVAEREILNGTSDDKFSPDLLTTRGMLVTVLHRLAGKPAVEDAHRMGSTNIADFTDVAVGKYYTDAVKWAAIHKIVNGMGDAVFAPNARVTREQVVAIMYRFAAYQNMKSDAVAEVEENFDHFADKNDISSWALEAVKWATTNGIISGKDGDRFEPMGVVTRAEIAKILMQFLQMSK